VQPCLSTQVVNEITVNLLRKVKFEEVAIHRLIQSLFNKYSVFLIDVETLLKASDLRGTSQFSFWDSLIVASALQHRCHTLYSEDMQGGLLIEQRLIIVNPFSPPC
jgi:predicted nucleic acid-binding protein